MRPENYTILLLHSAPVVRRVTREILEQKGYVVRATGDLGVAVDMLHETKPDLLLVDLYVGDISGHDAAMYLTGKCPSMGVLIIAGVPADQRMENRTVGEGFRVFPKPFHPADLLAAVDDALDANRKRLHG